MNQDKIHDALNYLDDDLIESVNNLRQKKRKKKYVVRGILASAASILIVLAGVATVFRFAGIIPIGPNVTLDMEKTEEGNPIVEEYQPDVDNAENENIGEVPENATLENATTQKETQDAVDSAERPTGSDAMRMELYAIVISETEDGFICEVSENCDFINVGDIIKVGFSDETVIVDFNEREKYVYSQDEAKEFVKTIKKGDKFRMDLAESMISEVHKSGETLEYEYIITAPLVEINY